MDDLEYLRRAKLDFEPSYSCGHPDCLLPAVWWARNRCCLHTTSYCPGHRHRETAELMLEPEKWQCPKCKKVLTASMVDWIPIQVPRGKAA